VPGSAGADTFVLSDLTAADTIADYNSAEGDVIDLTSLFMMAVGQNPVTTNHPPR